MDLSGLDFVSSSGYSLIEELGRGGMGVVYLAEKNCEGVIDYVVLKSVLSVSGEHVGRLRQEANIATMLRHENIVKTYGLEAIAHRMLPEGFLDSLAGAGDPKPGAHKTFKRRKLAGPGGRRGKGRGRRVREEADISDDEKLFLMCMDYIDGADLDNMQRAHLDGGFLIPPIIAGFIISRICRALGYAHEWIVHRDVTPENILINNQGVCKLTDFGVAVSSEANEQVFAGKLHYMAPEQLARERVDNRCDIFALGMVAYLIVTGIPTVVLKPNMTFQQQQDFVNEQLEADIIPPHEVLPDVPVPLSKIIMKMLAKDRDERYQDIALTARDFEQKYLYAEGFGPTNNSLAAYMEIFEQGFKNAKPDQLRQLTFLKGDDGKLRVRRTLSWDKYTTAAKRVISAHKGTSSYLYRTIAKQRS